MTHDCSLTPGITRREHNAALKQVSRMRATLFAVGCMPLLGCALAKTSSLSSLVSLKEPETSGKDNGSDSDEHQYHAPTNPLNSDPIRILSGRHTVRVLLPDGIADAEIAGSKRRHEKYE